MIPTRITGLAGVVALVALTAGVATPDTGQASSEGSGIHKIKHVVVIMQENRSFDHYFGTFPGANGLPTRSDGSFAVCVPDPGQGRCRRPYHDTNQFDVGGPHGLEEPGQTGACDPLGRRNPERVVRRVGPAHLSWWAG